MKTIREWIADERLENYLLDDLRLLLTIQARSWSNNVNPIFESYSFPSIFICENFFDNYELILKEIFKHIRKIPKEFSTNKILTINIKSVQDYPKIIYIKLINDIYNDASSATLEDSTSRGNVYIKLNLAKDFRWQFQSLEVLILHELLHGYENFLRLSKGESSIFNDLTKEYENARIGINDMNNWLAKHISIMGYFFNEHELFAYINTLRLKITQILNAVKPSYKDLKYEKILNELKKEYVWKQYFNFGKFAAFVDNISDEDLEKAYERIYDDNKSADDIRKTIDTKWKEFNSQFNAEFLKVLDNKLRKS